MNGEHKARVTYVSDRDGSEIIELDDHEFQMGGIGDGYCYSHCTFDCLDNLTDAEREALKNAE